MINMNNVNLYKQDRKYIKFGNKDNKSSYPSNNQSPQDNSKSTVKSFYSSYENYIMELNRNNISQITPSSIKTSLTSQVIHSDISSSEQAEADENKKTEYERSKIENDKKTQVIQSLRDKFKPVEQELFIEGRPIVFDVFKGTKSGSNEGCYVIEKSTNELYYAKKGGVQSRAEILASKLYKMAGINVPELREITTKDGKTQGVLSRYIPGLTPVRKADSIVNNDFGMDVLLANWDSKCSNNTCITLDNKSLIVDCGCSLDYRAQGNSKPFKSIPIELLTLINPYINSESAEIYRKLTREDIITSIKKAVDLKDDDIIKLLRDMNLPQYEQPLLQRKKFLGIILEKIKANPIGNDSIFNYMQKQMNSALETAVENAEKIDDLIDIKNALDIVEDKNVKQSLQDKISEKEIKLNEIKSLGVSLTENDVKDLLTDKGFQKISFNRYKFEMTPELKEELIQQYGSIYGYTIKDKLETPLNYQDIRNIQTIINAADGEYADFWKNNVFKLVQIYQNIKDSRIFANNSEYIGEMKKGDWETIVNIAKNPPSEEIIESLHKYKGAFFYAINSALTDLKYGQTIPSQVENDIQNIQSYISTQVIHSPIKVRRAEGYEIFESVIKEDGSTINLGEEMENAKEEYLKTKDKNIIENLINKYADETLSTTQERFMSTTLVGPPPIWCKSKIQWDLEIDKNSKGVFIEGIPQYGHGSWETELLLQKDSKIEILGLEYDYVKNVWIAHGRLSN